MNNVMIREESVLSDVKIDIECSAVMIRSMVFSKPVSMVDYPVTQTKAVKGIWAQNHHRKV